MSAILREWAEAAGLTYHARMTGHSEWGAWPLMDGLHVDRQGWTFALARSASFLWAVAYESGLTVKSACPACAARGLPGKPARWEWAQGDGLSGWSETLRPTPGWVVGDARWQETGWRGRFVYPRSRPCPACDVEGVPTGIAAEPLALSIFNAERIGPSYDTAPLVVLADELQANGRPLGAWLAAWTIDREQGTSHLAEYEPAMSEALERAIKQRWHALFEAKQREWVQATGMPRDILFGATSGADVTVTGDLDVTGRVVLGEGLFAEMPNRQEFMQAIQSDQVRWAIGSQLGGVARPSSPALRPELFSLPIEITWGEAIEAEHRSAYLPGADVPVIRQGLSRVATAAELGITDLETRRRYADAVLAALVDLGQPRPERPSWLDIEVSSVPGIPALDESQDPSDP